MNAEMISDALGGADVEFFDIIDSTNTYVKKIADSAREGHIVIAKEQSGGRGRLGRSFFSPPCSGIYMSVLLKPAFGPGRAVDITAAAAVAVAEAIEQLSGRCAQIKWVNDIYVDGKKVCGILTEAAAVGDVIKYAVLGIGINVNAPKGGFPKEIKEVAGCVFENADDKISVLLVKKIIERFFDFYRGLEKKEFFAGYRKRIMFLGEMVNVISAEKTYEAIPICVEDDFSLTVKTFDGGEKKLRSGEISIRPKR